MPPCTSRRMVRTIHDNVGAADSAVRFVLAILCIAGAALLWGIAPPDYAPSAIFLLIPTAYLLMTAVIHVDLLYAMLGFDTVAGHVHHRAVTRPRI